MVEIFFNEKLAEYTLNVEISGIKSIKKVPLRFKFNDKTSRFRKDILKSEIFN